MDSYVSKFKRIAETTERPIDKARYFLALLRVDGFKFDKLPITNVPDFKPQMEEAWDDLIIIGMNSVFYVSFPDPEYEETPVIEAEDSGYDISNDFPDATNPINFGVYLERRPG